MKKLIFAAIAAFTLTAIAPAQGGKMMGGKHVQPESSTMSCCTMNLTAGEKKSAMAMMAKWSRDEKAAWDKRCMICMGDPHTMMMKVEKSHAKITPEMVHMHMVSGLSKPEAMSMDKILADKKDQGVIMKMAENCCMYGVKHAAHKGK